LRKRRIEYEYRVGTRTLDDGAAFSNHDSAIKGVSSRRKPDHAACINDGLNCRRVELGIYEGRCAFGY